jgi:opacity protein-like surface antigen
MRTLTIAALALLATGAKGAEDDCIENAAGQLVCGADADLVRARLAAEERLGTPELNVPPAPARARVSVVSDTEARVAGADAVGPILASADGPQEEAPSVPRARGSVYSSYKETAFLRGGYVFDTSNDLGDYQGPQFSVGYRKVFAERGRSAFSIEGELIYSRDSDDILVLGVPVELTIWGLSGVGAVRWQYALGAINPYASLGIGPGYFHASADDGVTKISDGDFTFVYTGRTGVAFNVSEQFTLETGYRYLGTSQSGAPAYHSAEVGLNYNF